MYRNVVNVLSMRIILIQLDYNHTFGEVHNVAVVVSGGQELIRM